MTSTSIVRMDFDITVSYMSLCIRPCPSFKGYMALRDLSRKYSSSTSCNTCFKALTSSILKLQSPIVVRSSVPSGSSSGLIPSKISSSRTLCCKSWTPVCLRLSKKKRGQRPPFVKSSIPKERFINLESSNIPRGMPLACQCFATLVRLESAADFPTKRYNPKSTERPRYYCRWNGIIW